jgi:dTMP kinase
MGKFITFEGGDGSGKSSALKEVYKFLSDKGYAVYATNDPGGCDISNQIRKILLTVSNKGMAYQTELLLYQAARAELVHSIIKPALNNFDFVLCDRFHDSTAIYQGKIRGWEQSFLDDLHKTFSDDIQPWQTFLFHVGAETGLSRSLGDEKDEGKWEAEGLAIHAKINDEFYIRAISDPARRFILINAEQDLKPMIADVIFYFEHHILPGGSNA